MEASVFVTKPSPVFEKSKMYILVKETLSPGHTALACAHASLGGYLHFVELERHKSDYGGAIVKTATEMWATVSFRKVVCSVNEEQFQEAKSYGVAGEDYRVMSESSLENAEVAIVFRPRPEWEPFFKKLQLYGKASKV